jgi:hypothetical protein
MPRRQLPPEEALMLPVLRAMLRTKWASQMSPASTEIRWHQKRLDLGLVSVDGLVVIELKVADWRRAIRQAHVNRWIAKESWVALWHETINEAAFNTASDLGVGILVVTENTAYPGLYPAPPVRPDVDSPVRSEIEMRGTRLRDLLSGAREVHRAAFA